MTARALHAAALGALLALATLPACSGEERSDARRWVESAEAAHRAADEAIARGELDEARAALLGPFEAEPPEGVAERDRRVVRQDLAFRLAEVELEAEVPEAALRWVERGLELGRGEDLFTANLLVARGRANEALGREREAAADYFEALEINDALLRRTLEEEEGP